jgi:hypothetical protein
MITKILDRLQKVKQTRHDQWIACCPAHDDKSPSLALKQCDNGKILVKCWAGCGIDDIVGAIGLELSDLFPNDPGYAKQERSYFNAETILKALHREAIIMRLVATKIKQGISLTDDDIKRAEIAENRIHEACSYSK